jgi:hypothetical protein
MVKMEDPKSFPEYFAQMRTLLDDSEHTIDPKTIWNRLTEIESITKSAKRALAMGLYDTTSRR